MLLIICYMIPDHFIYFLQRRLRLVGSLTKKSWSDRNREATCSWGRGDTVQSRSRLRSRCRCLIVLIAKIHLLQAALKIFKFVLLEMISISDVRFWLGDYPIDEVVRTLSCKVARTICPVSDIFAS